MIKSLLAVGIGSFVGGVVRYATEWQFNGFCGLSIGKSLFRFAFCSIRILGCEIGRMMGKSQIPPIKCKKVVKNNVYIIKN
jgi:hypothetical protein